METFDVLVAESPEQFLTVTAGSPQSAWDIATHRVADQGEEAWKQFTDVDGDTFRAWRVTVSQPVSTCELYGYTANVHVIVDDNGTPKGFYGAISKSDGGAQRTVKPLLAQTTREALIQVITMIPNQT